MWASNSISRALQAIAAGVAFYVAALLCNHLALPPGYASPVWAPSGIALGALLAFGPWCLIGTALAHGIANLRFGADAPTAALIALGGLAQAGAVWHVLCDDCRRGRKAFEDLACVQRLLWACALGAGVSATVGMMALSVGYEHKVLVDFSGAHFLLQLLAWTSGDFLGLIIFAPAVVFLFHERKRLAGFWPALAIFGCAAAAFSAWPGEVQWWAMAGAMLAAGAVSCFSMLGTAQRMREEAAWKARP